MRVAGVDGTKGGWVAILLEDGVFTDDRLLPLETPFDELGDAKVVAVDVPIGFGPRAADKAARRFLAGAASTVFTTPSRELLELKFGPGLGVSAQAHALGRRILHMTDLAAHDQRLHEVHPEVSFRAMNNGRPLPRKKTAAGALQRLELLRRHGIDVAGLGETGVAPLDDVLDAAAAAWSAQRIAGGTAVALPDPPELDGHLRVAIWY